jgi:hypothetical protein
LLNGPGGAAGVARDRVMPTVGPLPEHQRAQAVAHVMGAVRGRDELDEATVDALIAELRQRFSARRN